MATANMVEFDGKVRAASPGCIAGYNSRFSKFGGVEGYQKLEILFTIDEVVGNDMGQLKEWLNILDSWGLPTTLDEKAIDTGLERIKVTLDCNYYNTYTKLVAGLSFFRTILFLISKPSTLVYENFKTLLDLKLKSFDTIQLYQLATYKYLKNAYIDDLHDCIIKHTSLVSIEQFKVNFNTKPRLNDMLVGNRDMKYGNMVDDLVKHEKTLIPFKD